MQVRAELERNIAERTYDLHIVLRIDDMEFHDDRGMQALLSDLGSSLSNNTPDTLQTIIALLGRAEMSRREGVARRLYEMHTRPETLARTEPKTAVPELPKRRHVRLNEDNHD